jgi:hypothetical protein
MHKEFKYKITPILSRARVGQDYNPYYSFVIAYTKSEAESRLRRILGITALSEFVREVPRRPIELPSFEATNYKLNRERQHMLKQEKLQWA